MEEEDRAAAVATWSKLAEEDMAELYMSRRKTGAWHRTHEGQSTVEEKKLARRKSPDELYRTHGTEDGWGA